MMKRKITSLLLILSILVSLTALSSCHGNFSAVPAFEVPEEFDETKEYEISFWAKNETNDAQKAVYAQAIADFRELYPNIKVTLKNYTNYDDIYNDVITNISTNTTPNVCITYPDHIATYLTGENVVVPLEELISDEKYGLGGSSVKFDSPRFDEIIPQFMDECVVNGLDVENGAELSELFGREVYVELAVFEYVFKFNGIFVLGGIFAFGVGGVVAFGVGGVVALGGIFVLSSGSRSVVGSSLGLVVLGLVALGLVVLVGLGIGINERVSERNYKILVGKICCCTRDRVYGNLKGNYNALKLGGLVIVGEGNGNVNLFVLGLVAGVILVDRRTYELLLKALVGKLGFVLFLVSADERVGAENEIVSLALHILLGLVRNGVIFGAGLSYRIGIDVEVDVELVAVFGNCVLCVKRYPEIKASLFAKLFDHIVEILEDLCFVDRYAFEITDGDVFSVLAVNAAAGNDGEEHYGNEDKC